MTMKKGKHKKGVCQFCTCDIFHDIGHLSGPDGLTCWDCVDNCSDSTETEWGKTMKSLIPNRDQANWFIDFQTVKMITEHASDAENVSMEQTEAVMLAMIDKGYAKWREVGKYRQLRQNGGKSEHAYIHSELQ